MMRDEKRRDEAQIVAEAYAPRPVSSPFMYGIVGVCLAMLALAVFAGFYDFDPLAYPIPTLAGLLATFCCSLVLRWVRNRQHAAAHRREYDRMQLR